VLGLLLDHSGSNAPMMTEVLHTNDRWMATYPRGS
jgi:hypothetical protein